MTSETSPKTFGKYRHVEFSKLPSVKGEQPQSNALSSRHKSVANPSPNKTGIFSVVRPQLFDIMGDPCTNWVKTKHEVEVKPDREKQAKAEMKE